MTRRRVAAAAAVAAALLPACGPPEPPAKLPPAKTPEKTSLPPPRPDAPAPEAPDASAPNTARETTVRDRLNAWAHLSFPDNADEDWRVLGVVHRGEWAFVEADSEPGKVGYPKFRFVVHFPPGREPAVAACYAWGGGAWQLLFDDPKQPSG